MKRIFGTDGIRGLVNEELTIELAMKTANAVSRLFAGKYETLLIASDTRNSKEMFENAITAGALSAGMNVEICGILPTPGLAYLTKKKKTVGIMISASHNPSNYNGLKVLKEGFKISDELEVEMENIILNKKLDYVPYGEIGKIKINNIKQNYINYLVDMFTNLSFNKKIALDVSNGAAYNIVNEIFDKLNLNYDIYYNEPNGFNINEDCGSTYENSLSKIVTEQKYDLGILFDGDADRCLFIDHKGNLVDGDKLIAINSIKLKKQNRLKNNLVVSTIMSNLGFEEFLNSNNIDLYRTNVGDKYVLEKMIECNAVIGGEQSGHIIFLDKSTSGDAILTSLETLEALSIQNSCLQELTMKIPEYPQKLKSISVKDKSAVMNDKRLEKLLNKYSKDHTLRVVIRPSGTEHKIRVMIEGKNTILVNKITDEFVNVIESIDYGL